MLDIYGSVGGIIDYARSVQNLSKRPSIKLPKI